MSKSRQSFSSADSSPGATPSKPIPRTRSKVEPVEIHIPPLVLDDDDDSPLSANKDVKAHRTSFTYLDYAKFNRNVLSFHQKSKPKRDLVTQEVMVDIPLDQVIGATYKKPGVSYSQSAPATAFPSINKLTASIDSLSDTASTSTNSGKSENRESTKSNQDRLKSTLQDLYTKACKQFNVLPKRFVLDHISDTDVAFRCKDIDDDDMRAICVALLSNPNVESLDFSDCNISDSGAFALAKLLQEHTFISELRTANIPLTAEGVRAICGVLRSHKYLRSLSLSGLHLRDMDAAIIEELIESNSTIISLDLSHNDFSLEGGVAIARALMVNNTIKNLDLSWNHLRGIGAIAIANALKKNTSIRVLNLSMNGFSPEGCEALGSALPMNKSLEELSLASNRVAEKSLSALILGFQVTRIKKLDLSSNPISPAAALQIPHFFLNATRRCCIRHVSLREVTVDREFLDLVEQLEVERGVTVECDSSIRKAYEKRPEVAPIFMQADPIHILIAFMNRKNLRATELFHTFTAAESAANRGAAKDRITRDAFITGLTLIQVPLTNHQVDLLVNKLDADNDGLVSVSDLIDAVKQHNGKVFKQKQREIEAQKNKKLVRKSVKELRTDFVTTKPQPRSAPILDSKPKAKSANSTNK